VYRNSSRIFEPASGDFAGFDFLQLTSQEGLPSQFYGDAGWIESAGVERGVYGVEEEL
jgi:hypothetical protein